jgi:uncharacterized membrane protein YfcA
VTLELLGLVALGFAVGTYGTLIGLGGGFVLVPMLLILYPSYKPDEVTATSLAVVFANTVSGSIAYARHHRIDYVTGLIFAAAGMPGVIAGVFLVDLVPHGMFLVLFAILMLGLAVLTMQGPPRGIRPPLRGAGVMRREMEEADRTYVYSYKLWQGIALSAGVGLISSLFGIGGGAIHVPAMIVWMHIPVQFAVATSQFILAFMTGTATAIHLGNTTLNGDQWLRALALGAGAVPGAQVGARIAQRVRGRTLMRMLSVALFILAGRLFVKGVFGV